MSHSKYNLRLGLWLFAIYLFVYTLFVALNAFAADLMESTPIAGVNLAILFGFGLIISAFVLALIYGFLCKADPGEAVKENEAKE